MRGFEATEEACFIVVMPGHIDAVLGKLLAVGGGGGKGAAGSPAGSSRLLRTKLFRPQPVRNQALPAWSVLETLLKHEIGDAYCRNGEGDREVTFQQLDPIEQTFRRRIPSAWDTEGALRADIF